MSLANRLNQLLQNPLVDTLANVYKKFKSSKSFYGVFYFLALFTMQQSIAWKYGSAISQWFKSLGEAWYYQLGAFVFEHGSIELVILGIIMLILLVIVESLKMKSSNEENLGSGMNARDNHGVMNQGEGNTITQTTSYQNNSGSIILAIVALIVFGAIVLIVSSKDTTSKDVTNVDKTQIDLQNTKVKRLEDEVLLIKNDITNSKDEVKKVYLIEKLEDTQKALNQQIEVVAQLQTELLKKDKISLNEEVVLDTGAKLMEINKTEALKFMNVVIRKEQNISSKQKYLSFRAVIYISLNNFEGAKRDYRKAIEIKPLYGDIIEYAKLLERLKEYQNAKEQYQKALELATPKNQSFVIEKIMQMDRALGIIGSQEYRAYLDMNISSVQKEEIVKILSALTQPKETAPPQTHSNENPIEVPLGN